MPFKSLDELKRKLQSFFADGLVVVVGSGLSVAEGIPGMGPLAKHLYTTIPALLEPTEEADWEAVSRELDKGADLESALQSVAIADSLDEKIRRTTASYIGQSERAVVEEVVLGRRTLRFSKLVPHLNPNPSKALPVVTTNYDRLIEIAAEVQGFGVNKLFVGHYAGMFDPELARKHFVKTVVQTRKSARLIYRARINVFKPHGSLGWYDVNGQPVQCELTLDAPQFIITPGLTKYRRGYDVPFDRHRDEANIQIDKASRFLVLGYGFNDDHLETHLEAEIKAGKPCLLLTHGLTDNAQVVIDEAPNMVALTYYDDGFLVTENGSSQVFKGEPLWDVETFVSEVLSA